MIIPIIISLLSHCPHHDPIIPSFSHYPILIPIKPGVLVDDPT